MKRFTLALTALLTSTACVASPPATEYATGGDFLEVAGTSVWMADAGDCWHVVTTAGTATLERLEDSDALSWRGEGVARATTRASGYLSGVLPGDLVGVRACD